MVTARGSRRRDVSGLWALLGAPASALDISPGPPHAAGPYKVPATCSVYMGPVHGLQSPSCLDHVQVTSAFRSSSLQLSLHRSFIS